MKNIEDYEIVDHGIDNSQYLQGCGVSYTEFTDVATGTGYNPYEALDNALEGLATAGYDVDSNSALNAEVAGVEEKFGNRHLIVKHCKNHRLNYEELEDIYYYVSIRVK